MQDSNEGLDYLIESEMENTGLDFKREYYHKSENHELIKDVMAMANAHLEDTKYIIFGVKLSDNERSYSSITSLPDQSDIEELIHNNIEPSIDISFYPYEYQNYKLAILEIEGYVDRPYISKKNYRKIKAGETVIRKGSTTSYLTRDDFDKIYNLKNNRITSHKIKIGFGEEISPKTEVKIIETGNIVLPSHKQKKNYEEKLKILREKDKSNNRESEKPKSLEAQILSGIDVEGILSIGKMYQENAIHEGKINIGRNYMGSPIWLSEKELEERISNVGKTYLDEDLYFLQENIGQDLNPYILNEDEKYLEDAYIDISIPSEVGFLFDNHYFEPNDNPLTNTNYSMYQYPNVEKESKIYRVREYIGTVRHKFKEKLFINPLKIVYNPESIDKTFILSYELHAENLTDPIKGSLEIKVTK